MSNNDRGRFVWYDLMTTDLDAAQTFYTKVLGWGTQPWGGGEKPYTMWTNNEAMFGGVVDLPKEARDMGAPPNWMAYIAVPDIDATIEQAKGMGARVLQPAFDIPEVGRIAVLADPQGAVFSLFTPQGNAPGNDGAAKDGEFAWHELATTDAEAAWSFYRELLGWSDAGAPDMGPDGKYQMFGKGGEIPLGGIYNKPAGMPGPSAWLHYVKVKNVDDVTGAVRDNGGTVIREPMDVPAGPRIAVFMDPQGAAWAVHS